MQLQGIERERAAVNKRRPFPLFSEELKKDLFKERKELMRSTVYSH